MELLSTMIKGETIEMTFADNADIDAATTMLHFRVPVAGQNEGSLEYVRLVALQKLRTALGAEIQAASRKVDQQ